MKETRYWSPKKKKLASAIEFGWNDGKVCLVVC